MHQSMHTVHPKTPTLWVPTQHTSHHNNPTTSSVPSSSTAPPALSRSEQPLNHQTLPMNLPRTPLVIPAPSCCCPATAPSSSHTPIIPRHLLSPHPSMVHSMLLQPRHCLLHQHNSCLPEIHLANHQQLRQQPPVNLTVTSNTGTPADPSASAAADPAAVSSSRSGHADSSACTAGFSCISLFGFVSLPNIPNTHTATCNARSVLPKQLTSTHRIQVHSICMLISCHIAPMVHQASHNHLHSTIQPAPSNLPSANLLMPSAINCYSHIQVNASNHSYQQKAKRDLD